jgi:two-component system response regulator NreC
MDTIRLMLVDDHEVVRTGLKTFLETQPGLQVIAEANNGREAIERALEIRPDIIVMDITMPDMDGLEATREIKAQWPEAVILTLTVHADKYFFMEMLSAGAAGYLTKQVASEELVVAIKSVARGDVYLQPALAHWLLEDYQRLAEGSEGSSPTGPTETSAAIGLGVLSEREQQVLELVAQAMTNSEIGKTLDLSPKTIARHRERIMHKLNLHSRTELVKFAIRTGLVENK